MMGTGFERLDPPPLALLAPPGATPMEVMKGSLKFGGGPWKRDEVGRGLLEAELRGGRVERSAPEDSKVSTSPILSPRRGLLPAHGCQHLPSGWSGTPAQPGHMGARPALHPFRLPHVWAVMGCAAQTDAAQGSEAPAAQRALETCEHPESLLDAHDCHRASGS